MPTSKSWTIVNGHSLRYELAGSGDETIVLCHEMGGALESWDRVIAALGARYKVLRYDQRGAGLSAKIDKLDFPIMLDDLDALLAHVGITHPIHLVGVAAGAAIAVQYAVAFPEKVASLVLSNPALNVPSERRSYLADRAATVLQDGMRAVEPLSLSKSYPEAVRDDSEPFEAYRGLFLGNDPQSYSALNLAFAAVDASRELQALQCRTLILAGTVDQLRPPATIRQMLQGHPFIAFEEIPGGHILPVQSPRLFAERLLAFVEAGKADNGDPLRPRINLVEDKDQSPAQRQVAQSIASGPRGKVSAPFRAWLNSPGFAQAAQQLGAFVRYNTSLGQQVSETAILVVANHWSCQYEWHIHEAEARKAGVPAPVIDLIANGGEPFDLDSRLATTIMFVRAVLSNHVGTELYQRASAEFGPNGVVEMVGLAGYYSMMAMSLNTFQILPQARQTSSQ